MKYADVAATMVAIAFALTWLPWSQGVSQSRLTTAEFTKMLMMPIVPNLAISSPILWNRDGTLPLIHSCAASLPARAFDPCQRAETRPDTLWRADRTRARSARESVEGSVAGVMV